MAKSIVDRPPGKALQFGLRLPIWLYHMRLGWLLGNRFLLLTHTGRKSGLPHETVIEVVRHDKDKNIYYVVSGWGRKSDWYQNIHSNPAVMVSAGGRKFHAYAEFIPLAKAVEIMEAYIRDHPLAFKELSSLFLGEPMKADADAAQILAERMPMVAFRPVLST